MANLPTLTPEQIEKALPGVSEVELVASGGQKVVFRATIKGEIYALKFALVPDDQNGEEEQDPPMDVVSARARREIATMRECASTHMVKLGPIDLTFHEIQDQSVLYFAEEFVAGEDLKRIIRGGRLPVSEVVKLGLDIADAIKALWDMGKVHRDIKPGNIMRRSDSGDFVLLDAGLAFDVVGESLSAGYLVGTMAYFSPEQFDYSTRRTGLDFRSDIFSLGATMYEAATGTHPFAAQGMTSSTLFARILEHDPKLPSELVDDDSLPETLDDAILQMLGKSQHLRFRTCDKLIKALQEVK